MTHISSKTLLFKVAEASSRDAGRAIARIDPQYFDQLLVAVGDVIRIRKHDNIDEAQEAVAKVMPTYSEDRGKGIIRIDGTARENSQVGVDEKVDVSKVSFKEANTVVLSALSAESEFRQVDADYIAKILDGTPVVAGNKIRVNLFGSRAQEFQVEHTDPADVATLITAQTRIKIKNEGGRKTGVGITYEDIGGLSRQLRRIREMIELPLKYPEVFERLGIDPPKGVLLHGPPGCGKTLIARAIANEADAYFVHISGPEIMGKFYGESEGRLREVFEDAGSHAPAILFIDEIDAIAPKREDMGGEKQVERRVVAQLLALMDGLESRGQVIVIGATNIPNVLDPALRRPGRFDREITIGIPDRNARKEILEIHTRGMPLAKDVDLEKIAEITYGFVGADLEALAREAAMCALRDLMPAIEFEKEFIPYEKLSMLEVAFEHFREALKEVEPSALREVFAEIPNTKWEDVGGLSRVKQILKEVMEWPLKYSNAFDQAKLTPPKGIVLHGSPGCGKTLLAKAVATELGANFISVKGPQILSKYIGESEKGIREIFKKARMASPCIIFFDEIDSLVPRRGVGIDSQVTERVVSQFLVELDGIEELKDVVVLAATNRLDMIDPALLRAGRFDFLLEIPKPNEEDRLAIFAIHTRDKPTDHTVDLQKLARISEGATGADIELICKKAAMSAIREHIRNESKNKNHNIKICWKHFEEVLDIKNSLKRDA